MVNANELMGVLHGFYGLGAMLSPIIATSLVTRARWEWFEFYYLMAGAAFLECVFLTTGFWTATGTEYRAEHPRATPVVSDVAIEEQQIKTDLSLSNILENSRTVEALRNKVAWLFTIFLVVYTGVELALGGWIVTFMIRIRHVSPFASGMTLTGFWAGMTVGRMVLGFVTPRLFNSERRAVAAYLLISVALELIFWLVREFYVSAVMTSLLGFFLGPLFPAAIIVAAKLLPKHIHVSAIGLASTLGTSGGTIFPFVVGAIAQVKGVQVLQPIVLSMLVVALGIWLCLPSLSKKNQ
jgi:fucose permease